MAINETLKKNILALLSQVSAISSIKLETAIINSWIQKLDTAGNDSEQLLQAWLPILKTLNHIYWCTKFDSAKFSKIDKRPALAQIRKACIVDLENIKDAQNRKVLAEQIAILYLVYANVFHLTPSGIPIIYADFRDVLDEIESFITQNKLEDSNPHALWHYLKACYASESNRRIWLSTEVYAGDEEKSQALLNSSVEHSSEAIRIQKEIPGIEDIQYRYMLICYANSLMQLAKSKKTSDLLTEDAKELCNKAWLALSSLLNGDTEQDQALITECERIKKDLQQISPGLTDTLPSQEEKKLTQGFRYTM